MSDLAEVHSLFGARVRGGSLDHAAFLHVLTDDGRPAPPITLPIEVKNIRHWLYPQSAELFQVLYKAACLQADHADYAFVPIILSRRRSYYTWVMASELGFFPIQTYAQFLLPRSEVDRKHFDEVRAELGYTDLVLTENSDARIVGALRQYLPKHALDLCALEDMRASADESLRSPSGLRPLAASRRPAMSARRSSGPT